MNTIIKLTKWEFYKLIKTSLAQILLGLLVVIMIGITISEYQNYQMTDQTKAEAFDTTWRDRENFLIEQTEDYMNDPYYDTVQKEAIARRIEIAQYKLDHNLPRSIYKNTWYFFSDNMFKGVSLILILFIAIIGAFSVATEYSQKTLTPMLLLPYKRSKLLTAKYLATFLYGALCLMVLIILGTLSGLIVYGLSGAKDSVILYGIQGPYVLSTFTYSLIVVAMKLVQLALMIFMAVMIAVLSKSSALATIITSLMLILGMPLTIFMSNYNKFWHFTPFVSSDLRKFLEFGSTMPSVENFFTNNVVAGINAWGALGIVVGYCVVFTAITYSVFCKADVK